LHAWVAPFAMAVPVAESCPLSVTGFVGHVDEVTEFPVLIKVLTCSVLLFAGKNGLKDCAFATITAKSKPNVKKYLVFMLVVFSKQKYNKKITNVKIC